MKTLREKMRSRKGFTLIEMLIVVAIIAILVAISIPLVSSSLNKARIATDQANERAAKAAAVIEYLTGKNAGESIENWFYNAEDGQLVKTFDEVGTHYGQCTHHKDCVLRVSVNGDNGTVTLEWVDSAEGQAKGSLHGIAGGEGATAGGGD